ncbi:MAG: pyrroline-5-carboxylate reductase [Atopostipes suicloacalis]|nr:pyrroline-5-carboxylate reductase [Atopostipes suicloacalis]
MNLEEVKIGFLGFGNMAQAIADGWLISEKVDPDQLYASARDQEKLIENTAQIGIHALPTNEDLVEAVDLIILAVKPHQIKDLLAPLENKLSDKIVIAVAVNFLFEDFQGILREETQHLSTLPNTPVAFADGIFLFEEEHSLRQENYEAIKELFQSISHVEVIPTKEMAIAGIVAGSAPAFVDLFSEALADAAVKHGLNRERAYRLSSQMIRGTANLQLKTGKHPGQLKDEITSPSGTTIKGIASLEKDAFRGSIIQAVDEILKD